MVASKFSEEKTKLVSGDLRKRGSQKTYGSVPSVDRSKSEDERDQGSSSSKSSSTSRGECIYIIVVLVLALLGIIIGEATLIPIALDKIERTKNCLISVDPGVYPLAAVSTDDHRCSDIARTILLRDGSAVDASIAALLCVGVVVPHSAGIGGGHFMTIYDKSSRHAEVMNAREKAPAAATQDMYAANDTLASTGGLAIGIPGEVKGMWEAHQKYGRLPWSSLFEDAIKLCRDGAKISGPLGAALRKMSDTIKNNDAFRGVFWNANTSSVYKEGHLLKRPKLGDTLERISLRGEDEFYTGETAKILVQDITAAGGIITAADLSGYTSSWVAPVTGKINGMLASGPPAPSISSMIYFIMNIMEGYKLTPEDLKTTDKAVLTYHRLVESYKFGRGISSVIGDPKFVDNSVAEGNLLSKDFAEQTRKSINDDQTYEPNHYYAQANVVQDAGTSHISVLAPDGSAVSVTTSVNTQFGSKVMSAATGIILNNQMDDFSRFNKTDDYGLPSSVENYIAPNKQPKSSMSPIIMVNETTGNVTGIYGAAGGSTIPSAITQVAMLNTWLGKKIHESLDEPRIHHQLIPNYVSHEVDFSQDILDGLKKKGHKLSTFQSKIASAVNVIVHTDRCVRAAADPRKGGKDAVTGF